MNNCTRCDGTGCEPSTPLDQTQTASPCERCKGTGTITGWKVGDEIVTVTNEAGTIVMNKAYADRMGIQGKPGRVVE